MKTKKILTGIALCLFASAASATIIEFTTGGQSSSIYPGQSFTTGAFDVGQTGWDFTSFTWLDSDGTTPVGEGTIFVFADLANNTSFTPNSMSSGSTGYVSQSDIYAGSAYSFSSAVTLAENTKYWILTDTAFTHGRADTGSYSGGNRFYAVDATTNWGMSSNGDSNFQATLTAVPEPSSIVLLLLGTFAGLVAFRRR
ncbi:PEP-CTERM sorting domain-containing protein [Kiritimatiellota bacterium B12222]|nr:PEP-CTERM sorting domain-containing protein [Kiritimatiellota bacterium B12222]